MTRFLILSVRFLNDRFHGLADNGERPEWPPSPFRVFQAMLAGNADGRPLPQSVTNALSWLESLSPPEIHAPRVHCGQALLTYVLNNNTDRSRTPKWIRPTILDGSHLVEYVWTLNSKAGGLDNDLGGVLRAVQKIRYLGWGIDLAIGSGRVINTQPLPSKGYVRYQPTDDRGGIVLRIPTTGSLHSLCEAYKTYSERSQPNGTTRLEPAGARFRPQSYSAGESRRPFAAFKLVHPDGDRERFATFLQYGAVHVAAMLRHAACKLAMDDLDPSSNRDEAWGRRVVAGHGPDPAIKRRAQDDNTPRLSYLSLPSFEFRGNAAAVVGAIRRVIVAEFTGGDVVDSIGWARGRLGGEVLLDEKSGVPLAILQALPTNDAVLRRYTGDTAGSSLWASVTPVILPGFDDAKPAKRDRLLRTCLEQSGLAESVESIESRPPAWFPGVVSSKQFHDNDRDVPYRRRPQYLRHLPAVHVLLRFRNPVTGPIAIGAGRHCGLGVLAIVDEQK